MPRGRSGKPPGAPAYGVVSLGCTGKGSDGLSPHLRSRHEVGDAVRAANVLITEFRAALIIGSGSISFEMMRYLTERLPLMIAPRWGLSPVPTDRHPRRADCHADRRG
jgi:uncharacterized protein YbjT (DUF2867 family)